MSRRTGLSYRFMAVVLKPLMAVLTRKDWHGQEHVPAEGGFVIAANHNTHVDPVAVGHYFWDVGRPGYYLAKASLFGVPVLGTVLRAAHQIPVHRGSRDASLAFRDAVAAVNEGRPVIVYPEGTITRDPDLWPMAGKTGAARIALTTGRPVIPVAQWGAHELLPPYAKRPQIFPRKTMHITAGPPVDLSDFEGRELSVEVLRAATERIMDAITDLLAGIRGETPPERRYDPRVAAQVSEAAAAEEVDIEQESIEPAGDEPASDESAASDEAEPAAEASASEAAATPDAEPDAAGTGGTPA